MGTRLLLVGAWLVPAAIVVLGLSAGATIWTYMEPQLDSLPAPDSYFVAAYSGLIVLALSIIVAVGISIHVVSARSGQTVDR